MTLDGAYGGGLIFKDGAGYVGLWATEGGSAFNVSLGGVGHMHALQITPSFVRPAFDTALALGQAIAQALGDKGGIARYGEAHAPMDETLARVALDISGRPYLVWKAEFTQERLGEWDTELIEHWFQSVGQTAGLTLHCELLYGQNNHHVCEAVYKGFARAMRQAVSIDPRKADAATIAMLREIGFNRLSFGVQDFDPNVQRAVNRWQPEAQTVAVIDAARQARFHSVSVDLIYGLPLQTVASFEHTADRIIALSPDRIALYNYAHLPTIFKPQRRIQEAALPVSEAKLEILRLAIAKFSAAGYVYIGMDHFAKPGDELAIAQRQGRLHRNFQGYSTHAECDLIALGVSAIGRLPGAYSQNVRTLDDYYDRLDRGMLPVMRGIELVPDDLIRWTIIQALMCHFELAKESIEIAYLIESKAQSPHIARPG